MTMTEFLNKWNGKMADFDGFYGAQCSDLAQYYNKEVYGGPFLTGAAAADLWETYPVDYYERILNTIDAIPKAGDMMIWKKTTALPWGHVGICVEAGQTEFKSFDQNWPTGSPCSYVNHNYNGVIGFLRPIKSPIGLPTVNEWKQKLQVYNSVFYKPEDVIKFIEDRKIEINTLNQAITDKDVTINNLNSQISQLEKDKNVLADELKVCQQAGEVNVELNNKLIQVTQELNQLKLNYEKLKSEYELMIVAKNNQIVTLTNKYNASKSSLKKLLIDYIFGKKI